jgi:hypothetical protein
MFACLPAVLQLTLDRLDLELMMRTGTRKQHKFARRLLPLISNPHWVLSTLVICNTGAWQQQQQQQRFSNSTDVHWWQQVQQ